MAASKSTIRDIFVKLSNVFPKDAYIIHNSYVISGPESELVTKGYYFCKLSPDAKEIIGEAYPSGVLYIPGVKVIKDDLTAYQKIEDEAKVDKIVSSLYGLTEKAKAPDEWHELSEEEKEKLTRIISEKEFDYMFTGNKSKSPIVIGKNLFPLISVNTLDNLTYAYDSYGAVENELEAIIFSYTHIYFQLYMLYVYLPLTLNRLKE